MLPFLPYLTELSLKSLNVSTSWLRYNIDLTDSSDRCSGIYLTASYNGAELFIANSYSLNHSTSAVASRGLPVVQ